MSKLIIAGGREFTDRILLATELHRLHEYVLVTEVVCGLARGADTLGKEWAEGRDVIVTEFPADWDKYGKSAGYKRNAQMATYSDALLAFWDGKSKGTKHMIDLALSKGLIVRVVRY